MNTSQTPARYFKNRDLHRKAAFESWHAFLQLHSRIARLRTGATAKFALTHARLRVLGVIARNPGGCISDIARELDLSRQAVHRVVHDMVRLQMIELEDSSRRTRERIPKLIAGGRVAAWCGLRWERRWFEQLAEGVETTSLQWMRNQAQRHCRRLPWRVDDPLELEPPEPTESSWQRWLQPVPGTGAG